MRLETGLEQDTQIQGVGTVKAFSIHATAKSFKILSSQIYTDKLGTAPRELGANALDAHKEAGHNEPFIVHLPNAIESKFTIRDFGTGMSRNKIETLYTTYFASDKTQTNDLIGGLGLGSKSPFCYVDQFTVISYYNKRKFVYSAFLSNGLPQIAFLHEEETKERNGMEISFPIKKDDIKDFNARAKEVYSYFKVKPIVKGISDFKFE
jgi:HSP90 family molecular chaperone